MVAMPVASDACVFKILLIDGETRFRGRMFAGPRPLKAHPPRLRLDIEASFSPPAEEGQTASSFFWKAPNARTGPPPPPPPQLSGILVKPREIN